MICSEVREYLFAFLDNELPAEFSIELQGHLERCPRCAHDAETERAVGHHLHSALNVSTEASRQHRLRWPRLVAGFAALLALALAARMVTRPDAQTLFPPFAQLRRTGPLLCRLCNRGTRRVRSAGQKG